MGALSPGERIVVGLDYGCTYSGVSLLIMGDQSLESLVASDSWPNYMDHESFEMAAPATSLVSQSDLSHFEHTSIEDPISLTQRYMIDPSLRQSYETMEWMSEQSASELFKATPRLLTYGYDADIVRQRPEKSCQMVSQEQNTAYFTWDRHCKKCETKQDWQRHIR